MSAGGSARHERHTLTECDEGTLHKSKTLDRALRSNALFATTSNVKRDWIIERIPD